MSLKSMQNPPGKILGLDYNLEAMVAPGLLFLLSRRSSHGQDLYKVCPSVSAHVAMTYSRCVLLVSVLSWP